MAALACVGVMLASVLGVVLSAYLINVTKNDDNILNLNNVKLSFTTILYDVNGEEYQRLSGEEHRIWKNLSEMSPMLPKAFMAVEDNTFEKHGGVNWKRSFAALFNDVLGKVGLNFFSSRQGGSTITQQLVKNLTQDDEQDAMRKLREMFRAMVLEKQYSKEMIMEAYLNTLRLTGRNAGVESGANVYFGKSVNELTLEECASLAAITKNPSEFNPFDNPEEHLNRRNHILNLMYDQKMITLEERDAAKAQPLNLADGNTSHSYQETNSYFTDRVFEEVLADLMSERGMTRAEATDYIYNGGLRIFTTVVPELQSAMEDEMINGTAFYERSHMVDVLDENGNPTGEQEEEFAQAAMISLTYDGGIAACVGGLGEKEGDRIFNRATEAIRQTGSTMKPIGAYALGIDYNKVTYSTALLDMPIQVPDYENGGMKDWPRNYSGQYADTEIILVDGLARSLNTIAVRTGERVGPEVIYDFLTGTLHVTTLDAAKDRESLAPMVLGAMTNGMTPEELAGAYMMFGNGGKFSTIHSYTLVLDINDNVILDKRVTTTQAISYDSATIMNRMLEKVLLPGGTASGLAPNGQAVGKTGTTSDDKDHWFVGLTPYYVTATWWGFDNPDALTKFQYSTHPPTTAWRNVMNAAQANLPTKRFELSSNVEELTYCRVSGDLAGPGCTETATGLYKPENPPGLCIVHN